MASLNASVLLSAPAMPSGDIDQNLGCDPFGQGCHRKPYCLPAPAALAIAGRNDHVAETGITEGGNDGFPMPPLP